jgi:predicted ribosomally synthesized peptide with SipW-like signal peptide
MTNSKTTKRALLLSVLSMVLCVSMLVGSTFAWFTDTASTAVNKIQAGNLDVELEYSKDFSEWKKVDDTTKLFEESKSWEPGRTEIVYLRVKNAGTLALKYTLGLYNLYNSTGKNILGKKYSLSDYVKLGAVEADAAYADRAAAISAVQDSAKTLNSIGDASIVGADLATNATKVYAMVLYMPTTVGNEANPKNKDPYWAAKVSFGISVDATQAVSESDSFGNTYDEDAATILSAISFSSGKHEITQNMQANGRFGAVQAERTAQFTINADVYAVYNRDTSGTTGGAMAVQADGNSKVIINGGDFRQVSVPADDPVCDLIYALGNAQIEINGGTFKAVSPERTLNCKDGSNAKITVKGGSFYKYDPSNPTLGANEVVVAAGYHVVQDGDWFNVVAD